MRFRRAAPEIHTTRYRLRKTVTAPPLQVFIPHDFISTRMNTYMMLKHTLKTRYLNFFRMNTYTKLAPNQLWNEHLRNNPGGWGCQPVRLPPTAYFSLTATVSVGNDAPTKQSRRDT